MLQIFVYNKVAFYRYIIVVLCIISFYLNYIMQVQPFYNIATKVSSRKKVLVLLVIYLTGNGVFCCEVRKEMSMFQLNCYFPKMNYVFLSHSKYP